MRCRRAVVLSAAVALVALLAAPVLAAPPVVKTVPWNPGGGIYTNPHVTYDGYSMLLMGVVEDPDGNLSSYEWDFGDGSPTVVGSLSGGGPANLEVRHIYSGAAGTPYTATLEVCDAAAECTSDTFRVLLENMNLDIEVNIAIDEALWFLHKRIYKTTIGTEPAGYWTSNALSATSSAIQAFAINEHLPPLAGGDPAEDPYIDTVIRGANWLLTRLYQVTGPFSGACGDVDLVANGGNGNGYLLAPNSSRPLYELGQVMDGLAALRTPTAVAVTGGTGVLGKTYQEIAEDTAEYYGWCQADAGSDQGGWRYSCNYDSDNSAAQWGAIGLLGVEQGFGRPTPQCLKDENLKWMTYSQYTNGQFGYVSPTYCIYGCLATTPSGMTQLALDDVPTTDPSWYEAEKWLCDRWGSFFGQYNLYAYYALAKAMRSAVGGTDDFLGDDPALPCATPVEWYAGTNGLARRMVDTQRADGSWYSSYWSLGYELSTAWGVVILKPTVICPVPIADCDADPATTTTGCPVEFDGSGSFHPGASNPLPGCGTEIVSYDWDFDDGGTATGETATHTFATESFFDVSLTVTDDVGATNFAICSVDVEPPPVTPNADPNGPYEYCIGIDSKLVLDGSASRDPDNSPCVPGNGIATYAWEIDFAEFPRDFDDAFGATTDQAAYYEAQGPGVYNVGLRVTDDEADTNDDFTTVTVYTRDDCPPRPCPNEPDGQGHWHRQCLGVPASEGGIDPGRNGRGPTSPTEPYFVEDLMPCANDRLEELGFYGLEVCDGMDADPPSDKCEQALKQLTALILNVCAYGLTDECPTEVSAEGCSSTNVGDLIDELANLIQNGECDEAKACADAVNSGDGGTGGGGTDLVAAERYRPADAPDGIAPTYVGGVDHPDPAVWRIGPRDLVDADRRGRFLNRAEASQHGVIFYYLVPRDYVPDDPRVIIGSWADENTDPNFDQPRRQLRKKGRDATRPRR